MAHTQEGPATMTTSTVDKLKNISEKDRKQIKEAEEMLGPDPETMGLIKNFFWGNVREELVFPYPERSAEEIARCDQLLAELDDYLANEHPRIEIDQTEEIPEWAIRRLFDIGVMGMTIPQEYGGGGYGVTSYNMALERIGRYCGSTAVLASAHQSIGCKALTLFGTEEQKMKFLPSLATNMVSAFCLSEPQVGCDAGGQETRCELSEDGKYYILNGEKKWSTSGAFSGFLTVMAKQKMRNPKTGKERDRVTALMVTPEMEGIDFFSNNRSKCCIRGTWQARIRFTDVKVPRENLLHKEGKGLALALTCLNYGRCTLSAGMVGGARTAFRQGAKWAETRYQFDRPLADFELVQNFMVDMASNMYAMEAMLYMTTGMMDRHDDDIMLETAICKIFCSHYGYQVCDQAFQIMGGEGNITENELERIWRDSRLQTIVEGANEVMHSFVFAYGSKQLGEQMMKLKDETAKNPKLWGAGMRLGAELFLGMRRSAPAVSRLSPELIESQTMLENLIRELSHQVKMRFKEEEEQIITNQMTQRRLSMAVIHIYAIACTLSRLDQSIRSGVSGDELKYEKSVGIYFVQRAEKQIRGWFAELRDNVDVEMRSTASVVRAEVDRWANEEFAIPESSPNAKGTGRHLDQTHVRQFGSGSTFEEWAARWAEKETRTEVDAT